MKPILFVVAGTVGVLSAPAVAGNSKKNRDPQKPSTFVASKTDAAKTDAAKPDAAKPDAAKPAQVAPAEAAPAPLAPLGDLVDIPALPADTSSALSPFPELEKRPVVTAKALAKPGKEKAPALKVGKDYMLGARHAAKPASTEVEQIIPRSLGQAQVATVVQSHMADIQNCWDLVPKAQREEACTAMLRLTISDAGVVTDIELGGDVPAGAHKCITSAIAKWTFPVAETKTEIEYGVSLRSL